MNLDTNIKPVKSRKLYIKNPKYAEKYFHPQHMTPELQALVGESPIARLVQTIIDKTVANVPESAVRVAYCRPIPKNRSTDSLQVILTTMQGMPTVSVECNSVSDPSIYTLISLSCNLGKTQKASRYASGGSATSFMRYASRLSDAGAYVNKRRARDIADLRNKISNMAGPSSKHHVEVPIILMDYIGKVLSEGVERNPAHDNELMKKVADSRDIIADIAAKQSSVAEFDGEVWVVMYHAGYGYTVTKGSILPDPAGGSSSSMFRATLPPVYAPTLDALPEAYRVPVMVKLKMLKAHREAVPDYPGAFDSGGLVPQGDKLYKDMGALTYCYAGVDPMYPQYIVLA